MNIAFLLLTIALAVAVGCYIGQKHLLDLHKLKPKFSRDYFIGLNFLLNEQPDKAVDVFTRLLQVDSETVETHLALGSLFRRRGEVGRAIKIHQNIIARPQLPKQQRVAALVALGKDYLHAGLIDRAERLFLEITSLGEQPLISLHYLLDIYQQQKNWLSAIKVAQQLKSLTDEPLQVQIAHYYCELAQQALLKNDTDNIAKLLKSALKSDENCVRANLLFGQLEQQNMHYKSAINYYEAIFTQDRTLFVEALSGLKLCYAALDQEKKLAEFLLAHLSALAHIAFILYLAHYWQKQQGEAFAIQFLTDHLRQRPSLTGLQQLIALQLHTAVDVAQQNDLLILQELIKHLLLNYPHYRCMQCGFKSNLLLWLCPGCRSWSQIKPTAEI
jgi:lipopolysaccharide biosynthesis regulator YciM